MPDKTIPVLDNTIIDHGGDYKPMSDFVYDLATWCEQWVDDVALPIMRRATDLYEDKAICALVFEYSRLVHERHDRRINALRLAAINDDGFVSTTYKLWDRDRDSINAALRFLLIPTDKED